MTPEEFVRLVAEEKRALLALYLADPAETAVGKRIEGLDLTGQQKTEMAKIVDEILRDAFYTLLLGLDGSAQIGGRQIDYRLADEDGKVLTAGGELEGYAWEQFHGDQAKPEDRG